MIIAIVVVAVLAIGLIAGFNALTKMRNVVKNAWSDIDVQLKRRADLIPNLVETTKGYSGFERDVLEGVTSARQQATAGGLSPHARATVETALATRLTQIIGIAESYPELKASANFLKLQEDLRDTEDKLASARQYYNAAVRDFNTLIELFPWGLIANTFGFSRAEHFSIDEAEQRDAPSAKLNP